MSRFIPQNAQALGYTGLKCPGRKLKQGWTTATFRFNTRTTLRHSSYSYTTRIDNKVKEENKLEKVQHGISFSKYHQWHRLFAYRDSFIIKYEHYEHLGSKYAFGNGT